MSYAKRALPVRLVRIADRSGDVLYPVDPAPFYRCEDRPRRIPEGHPMATRKIPPQVLLALPERIQSTAGRLAVAALAGFLIGCAASAARWL